MRGDDTQQQRMFCYLSPEERVPKDHPLRSIRILVDNALLSISSSLNTLYSHTGRPSIAPEQLLRAMVIQILYSIRSERMLVEQLDYNLLFRWFVGLSMEEMIWNHSTFSKNRDRLLSQEVATEFFRAVLGLAKQADLLSNEHFTVDGSMIEAWASMKSFRPKDKSNDDNQTPPRSGGKNPSVDFKGHKRKNDTHQSTTDPQSRLFRKAEGQQSKLCYLGHVLMENRNGLVVNSLLTQATGTAEREAALKMLEQVSGTHRITLGADKGYDVADFVQKVRQLNATPHVAQKKKGSAIDGRTTTHDGYATSLRVRKRVEEIFGWMKTVGLLRKTRHRGLEKISTTLTLTLTAYNLVRMRNLIWAR